MDRFVRRKLRKQGGDRAILKSSHLADIGVGRTQFEPGCQRYHVSLRFQLAKFKIGNIFGVGLCFDGLTACFGDEGGKRISMALVMAKKHERYLQHIGR